VKNSTTFVFLLTGLLFHNCSRWVHGNFEEKSEKNFGVTGVGFSGQMPFLSPSQWCERLKALKGLSFMLKTGEISRQRQLLAV